MSAALAREQAPALDFSWTHHGTIVTFLPLNQAASEWWTDNVDNGPMFGDAYVVEHRFAWDILNALVAEGFNV